MMTDYGALPVGVYKNMDYMLHVRMRILLNSKNKEKKHESETRTV